MRSRGRKYEPLTKEEKVMIRDFLDNELSYAEMADKVGITALQLRYKVQKYHKELKAEQEAANKETEHDTGIER